MRKTPSAIGQHTEAKAERAVVRDRRHFQWLARAAVVLHTKANRLIAVPIDPDISIRRAGGFRLTHGEGRKLANLVGCEPGSQNVDPGGFPATDAKRRPDRRTRTASAEECPT